ncbi:MAG: DNA alkylation repair protein [Phenylobacterium sp.]|nr:DNA alkylation repair protein [Phenylobacterium sp.]
MHPDHALMLEDLRRLARPVSDAPVQNDSYGGSGRPFFNISVPHRRAMAKAWLARHRAEGPQAALALVESLFDGASHEEKTLAAILLGYSAPARAVTSPADLDRWLGKLNGWAEVDNLCQNIFSAAEMGRDWPAWKALIEALTLSPDINRRRAALVLLTGPTARSDDDGFHDLAFRTIEALKGEKPILITKAVSWLLRAMAARRPDAVAAYLDREADSLPAVAVRETRIKLTTGTKSGKRRGG